MSYKKKTEPGRELDFFEAIENIYHGYYVYFKDRPTHPGYTSSMSLQTIRAHCSVGDIKQCLSVKTGRPYAKYHIEESEAGTTRAQQVRTQLKKALRGIQQEAERHSKPVGPLEHLESMLSSRRR